MREMENQWKQQTIGIAGCGGLGGNLMENFLRLGITHLVVCDGDVFEYSNMDRQILCTEDSIGKRTGEENCSEHDGGSIRCLYR